MRVTTLHCRLANDLTQLPPIVVVFPSLEGLWVAIATNPHTGQSYYGLSEQLYQEIHDMVLYDTGRPLGATCRIVYAEPHATSWSTSVFRSSMATAVGSHLPGPESVNRVAEVIRLVPAPVQR